VIVDILDGLSRFTSASIWWQYLTCKKNVLIYNYLYSSYSVQANEMHNVRDRVGKLGGIYVHVGNVGGRKTEGRIRGKKRIGVTCFQGVSGATCLYEDFVRIPQGSIP
jgi:uncharacterized membrane protein